MPGYVDIHSHVLPGIDDGPPDLSESIVMARAAAAIGIRTLAATPHLRSDFPGVHIGELAERCRQTQDAIMDDGIALELVCGSEASLMWAIEASDEDLRLATYRQRGSDLLVETPSAPVLALDRFLYEIRVRGIRVTLAHPERSPEFQREPERLRALVRQGVLLQVNAGSLLSGARGSRVRRLAELLCQEGLAHVMASDGHRGVAWRPVTKLSDGIEALTGLVGAERAHWMVSDVPRAIVDGVDLPVGPPVQIRPKRRRLFDRR